MRLFILAGVVGFAVAAQAKTDDKAVMELKKASETLMQDWLSGNAAGVKAVLSESMWGGWDIDMAGRPMTVANPKEAVAAVETLSAGLKAMHATATMKFSKNECSASGDMGVCMMEGETMINAAGMPPMTAQCRVTEVFRKEKGRWMMMHHHGSIAKAPEMPAKSMVLNAKTAMFQDMPGMTGMKVVGIWMNPVTQAMASMIKIGPEGRKEARHFHDYAMTVTVLEGSIVTSDSTGKEIEYGPGTVLYRAPKEIHTTTFKPGSAFLVVADGPFDTVYVDDKGKPTNAPAN